MKFVDEFRDKDLAIKLSRAIHAEVEPGRKLRFMEFCGGHTHAVYRYGLPSLLPAEVQLIHGPGCPVCVLPIGRLEQAIELAKRPNVTLCTYGDMVRVPAKGRRSLLQAKAEGADIRIVFGSGNAIELAQKYPDRQIVFFAIGFETTAPTTAAAVVRADQLGLENFSVFCNHVLTPAAIDGILSAAKTDPDAVDLDGFIGPGHVSTIIGAEPYERFASEYEKAIVISGFEPVDLMQSVLMLVRQVKEGRHVVENQYTRVVQPGGNKKAQTLVDQVMELREEFEWRGLGTIEHSALQLRPEYARFDAERRFEVPYEAVPDHKACACGDILRGRKNPLECKIFGTACTPETPLGACMVSPEGSCSAYYQYAPHQEPKEESV